MLCAATTCCSVACWDRRAGKGHQAELTASARGECDPSLSAVTVSADGTLVAAGGGAGRVHIWDIRHVLLSKLMRLLPEHGLPFARRVT